MMELSQGPSVEISGRKSGALTFDEICRTASELCKFVKADTIIRAKLLMKNLGKDDRSAVMKVLSDDGVSPLFLSAQLGRLSFVNFFLDECFADIEQRGTYEVIEDRSRHEVTPLWCAAVANKLDVVLSLLRHGADVNAMSDTLSTPVRSACYMTNIDVVRCLVENGADIQRPNINGGTCLINSVQSVELCEYLIKQGANVNAIDNSGNLALHYAIREGRMDAVKLLMKYGSDPTVRNDFGDDAIQTAALRGYSAILDYLIDELKPDSQRRADVYSLMAANCVDDKHDIAMALDYWRQAVAIRQIERINAAAAGVTLRPPPAANNTKEKVAYNFAKEWTDIQQIADMSRDVNEVYMQALLVRERILGPDHKDTIFGLMYRGAVYADTHNYQRCIDLWKYAFHLRRATSRSSVLAHEYLFTLQALCKLFLELYDEENSNSAAPAENPLVAAAPANSSAVNFGDALDVFAMTVDEVHETSSVPPEDLCAEEFLMLLQLAIHQIHLLSNLAVTPAHRTRFMQLVHSLVRANPRTCDSQQTLMHLAVDPAMSSVADEFYSTLPNAKVIAILLEAGAAVNCVDRDGNSVMHTIFMSPVEVVPSASIENILKMLVAHGEHIDIANNQRQTVLSRLPPSICLLSHLSLKCLTARVIRHHKIEYLGLVPASLNDFIKLH